MITKNRLEELIQKEITFYVVCWGKIKTILPNDLVYMDIEEDTICYEVVDDAPRTTDLGHLFETREDAEWYLEFGRIQRVERLKLPTWEELNNILQTQKYFEVNFKNKYETVSFFVNECQIAVMQQGHNYLSGLDKEFNKENYILACRKCKALFLGEQNGH